MKKQDSNKERAIRKEAMKMAVIFGVCVFAIECAIILLFSLISKNVNMIWDNDIMPIYFIVAVVVAIVFAVLAYHDFKKEKIA